MDGTNPKFSLARSNPKSVAVHAPIPLVSIIVPARNEEDVIGDCLGSLSKQQDVAFEIILVDDGSTDRTGEIARSVPGLDVIPARPLPNGWTGKNNACWTGAIWAKGEWLLFTDADTIHEPHALRTALNDAAESQAQMVSFSPKQILGSIWEMMVMPVIFAELARQYPPVKVRDPNSRIAAANGQFLLVEAKTYRELGGHEFVRNDILEDVALAKRFKSSGKKIFFDYGGDVVRTRMYRSLKQLIEGWTKNLALLFPRSLLKSISNSAELIILLCAAITVYDAIADPIHRHLAVSMITLVAVYSRLVVLAQRAHFGWWPSLLAPLGRLFFIILLLRSYIQSKVKKRIQWKGREYQQCIDADAPGLVPPKAPPAEYTL